MVGTTAYHTSGAHRSLLRGQRIFSNRFSPQALAATNCMDLRDCGFADGIGGSSPWQIDTEQGLQCPAANCSLQPTPDGSGERMLVIQNDGTMPQDGIEQVITHTNNAYTWSSVWVAASSDAQWYFAQNTLQGGCDKDIYNGGSGGGVSTSVSGGRSTSGQWQHVYLWSPGYCSQSYFRLSVTKGAVVFAYPCSSTGDGGVCQAPPGCAGQESCAYNGGVSLQAQGGCIDLRDCGFIHGIGSSSPWQVDTEQGLQCPTTNCSLQPTPDGSGEHMLVIQNDGTAPRDGIEEVVVHPYNAYTWSSVWVAASTGAQWYFAQNTAQGGCDKDIYNGGGGGGVSTNAGGASTSGQWLHMYLWSQGYCPQSLFRISATKGTVVFAYPCSSTGDGGVCQTPPGCTGMESCPYNGRVPLGPGLSTANATGNGSSDIKATFCTTKVVQNANDPVNCATGDFYNTFTDLSVPGRGLPLQFSRTYNSLSASQDSPLGYGWTDSYNAYLSTDVSGVITATEGNGSSVTFSPDGSGGYQAPSRVLATLVKNGDGTLTLTRDTDQQKLTFTAPTTATVGPLVAQTDRNGYTTTLTYDMNGHLSTITDPAGRSLTVLYNAAGRIAGLSDPIGRRVAYTYDSAGNLTAVQDVGGNVTRFGYYDGTHLLHTITDPKGNALSMMYDPSGRVTSVTDPLGQTGTMTYTVNADGSQTTTETNPNGNVTIEQYMNNELLSKTVGYGTAQAATWQYTYDPATLGAASVTDPNGHTSHSTYDARGNLLSHTDGLGRTTAYAYDALNDTTAITDPLGVTTAMTYDVGGNLLQTSRPLTQTGQTALTTLAYDPAYPGDVVAKTDPNGHTSRYAYDADGNLTSTSDPAGDTTSYGYDLIGRKTSIVDPRGNAPGGTPISYTTTMTYDAFGDTTAVTDALGRVTTDQYDANQNLITATDPLGRQTIYGYDGNNHRTSVQRPDGTILSTSYDPAGNVVTRTDALGRSTITSYDALNRVSSVTDPLNRTTTTQYDSAGNIITTTDPLGHQTVYGYDMANERTSVRHADGGIDQTRYDADGRVIAKTDPLSHTTTYAYDSLGHRTSVVDPLGRTTVYTYDLAGNRVAMADALSRVTAYQYDAADRLITTTDALSGTTILDYDPAGNTRAKTDANGHTTRQIYDAGNELIKVIRPDQGVLLTQYDAAGNAITKMNALGRDTVYGYDSLNRLTSMTDPRGATTAYQFDAASNVITTTDALGHQTVASYDAADEKTGVRQADGSLQRTAYDADGNVITQTDALARNTVYGYDTMNRVVTTTDPLTRTTTYTYDLAGNKTALTDSMGRTTQYGYDADNELTSIGYSDGQTPNVAYTYTATGQRRTMADGTGTTTDQYDALDRPITVTNGANQSVGYGYDAVGNVTALTYPAAAVVTRTYDTLDRLAGITDWLGHATQFGYDADSNLITTTLPNTTSVAQGYNAADQLTAITDTQGANTLWSYGYGRDLLGQVITSTDPLDGKAHSYGYSPLDQLTSDQQSGALTGTATWAPNAAQEITQQVNPTGPTTTTSTYDLAHELTALRVVSGTTPTQNLTLTYNGDGDRTSQADGISGASTAFGYDQADRLISAVISTTASITTASYSYDGDGLRAGKAVTATQGTTTTAQTWDTAEGLPALLQDGATRYITGPDGTPLEQVGPDGKALYYLHDQLGSTRALLDGSGNTQATYTYDPYGNLTVRIISDSHATTPFGFAGQYTDAETGLQYLRARYYDPTTSQFLSVDPLVDTTGQPYAYTTDNPLNLVDPTGELTCGGVSGTNWTAQRFFSAWGDTLCGVANGVGSGAHDAATGLGSTASFAWRSSGDYVFDRSSFDQQWAQTNETLCLIGQDPGGAARTVWQGVSQPYVAAWQRGDYGYLVGRGEFDVLSSIATAKGLDKLRYLSMLNRASKVEPVADLVPYDPEFASRQILGQPWESGYAVTPGGRTVSAHAAERIAYGGSGRPPTTLPNVDQILDTGTRVVYDPVRNTIRVNAPHLPGKPYVVVDAANTNHIVTVMVPK